MAAFFDTTSLPKGLIDVFGRSRIPLTIADAGQDDHPLVGVNARFCDICGYTPQQVLGRNCRFLQPAAGVGPVRKRMNRFLTDDTQSDAKFVVPNVRSNGDPFINLVYMAKLAREGKVVAVLGSQFAVDGLANDNAELYEQALNDDLTQLATVLRTGKLALLGSFEALANAHAIIARVRIEHG